jgi:2-iminobutanoate/2-iminopropanoate deaminase
MGDSFPRPRLPADTRVRFTKREDRVTVNSATAEAPYSSLRVAGGLIFLAGQVGRGDDRALVELGVAAETAQIFRNITRLLDSVGATLDDVLSCLVHLADLSDYEAFNLEYLKHFPRDKPVRTTVGADLVSGVHVEITVVAKQP